MLKKLDDFPLMKKLMGDLQEFRNPELKEIRNAIVLLCARASKGPPEYSKKARKILCRIKRALRIFMF